MKRILIAAALLIFLSSCTQTPAPAPTATATKQPTATLPPQPTATVTQVAPSMENIPAEWANRIDRVEEIVDMDGVQRTVAVEKSSDPDKESRLRALQWDPGAGEWTAYEPQVGKISQYEPYWADVEADNLSAQELLARMNQEVIHGKDGQEIEPGVVADFADYTLLCGDVVEISYYTADDGNMNIDQVVAVTIPTGDIQLFMINGNSPTREGTLRLAVYDMESIDPQSLPGTEAQSFKDVLTRFVKSTTLQGYWRYTAEMAQQKPLRRIVFGVSKSGSPQEFRNLDVKFDRGEILDADGLEIMLEYPMIVSPGDADMME